MCCMWYLIRILETTGCPKKKLALGNTLFLTSGGVFWTHLEFYCPDTPQTYCQDTPECTPQDKILFWLLKYLGERRNLIIVKYPKANFFLGHPVHRLKIIWMKGEDMHLLLTFFGNMYFVVLMWQHWTTYPKRLVEYMKI